VTSPRGFISILTELLMDSLANSSEFQDLVGATGNATKAASAIYRHALPPPEVGDHHTVAELEALRPCAIVALEPPSGLTKVSTHEAEASGSGYVRIEWDVPTGISRNHGEVMTRFEDILGQIGDELSEMGRPPTAGRLAVTAVAIDEEEPPRRSAPKEAAHVGDYVTGALKVSFGATP